MKLKFIVLTFLLLFTRGCDFYSTSLWFFQEGGMADETNPLTRFFGVGWNGLILTNVLVVMGIIALLYFFYFRYKRPFDFSEQPKDYKELASLQYFSVPNRFYQIFYKVPKNKKVFYAHFGYTMTVTVIVGGILATFHNISQYYSFEFYDQFRELVGRPLFVIYGLIFLTIFLTYRRLLLAEFEKYKSLNQVEG